MPQRDGPSPRDLVSTGWIGEHPSTGQDVAHLLITPASAAIAEGMQLLVDTLGLSATAPADVPTEFLHATVAAGVVTLRFADGGELARLVDREWSRAAHAQGFLVLSCGTQPRVGPDTIDAIDAHVLAEAAAGRVHMGMVRVR